MAVQCHIKSINEGNILIFGTNKVMIISFVVRNSHRFSFVFWATIGLARIFLPNVNQFFESLYVAKWVLIISCIMSDLCPARRDRRKPMAECQHGQNGLVVGILLTLTPSGVLP